MEWTYYKYGFLGKAASGYFFVYEKLGEERVNNRWFVTFDLGHQRNCENGTLINSAGYGSPLQAQRAVLAFSNRMDDVLGLTTSLLPAPSHIRPEVLS
jgi:hypothetical protein